MQLHHTMKYSLLVLWLGYWMASPCWALNQPESAYQQAVSRIIEGFDEGTAAPFNQALDAESIADKATELMLADLGWTSKLRPGLIQGIKQGVGEKIVKQMYPGSYVKLLKLSIQEGGARALLRFDYGDQGTGYIELMLKSSPEGEVRIVDWYDYAMGQRYSTSLRQLVAIMAPSPTFLGKLYDVASDRKEVYDTLQNLFILHKRQEHTALAQSFLAQDESVRGSRVLNLIAVHSANASGDNDLYHKTLANLEHFHGNDEKLFFILLDYYFIEEKYDRILVGLEKFKTHLGRQDAHLEVIKSNTLSASGDFSGALSAAEQAVSLEPDYEWAHMSQFSARTGLKDYAGAVKTAIILEERFDYDLSPEALGTVPEYSEFVNSEAYRQWRGGR